MNFTFSVAKISTAFLIGVFCVIGVSFNERIMEKLTPHTALYLFLIGIAVTEIIYFTWSLLQKRDAPRIVSRIY